MPAPMLNLSDLIIQHKDVTTFAELIALIRYRAERGERFLHFDIKPDFPDTPRNWEFQLESAFMWGDR